MFARASRHYKDCKKFKILLQGEVMSWGEVITKYSLLEDESVKRCGKGLNLRNQLKRKHAVSSVCSNIVQDQHNVSTV